MACCGSNPQDHFACVCCDYPNGAAQLVVAQTVLFFALILSVASMSDCEFVVADVFPEATPSLNNESTINATKLPGDLGDYFLDSNRRGMGFFFFETTNGECNYDAFDLDILDWYWEFLGSNWRVPRAFGSVAATVGWLLWLWSLSFSCAAHPRVFRYIAALYHIVVFGLFQLLTLLILGSDFCSERECELGRSAILSILSGSCFVVSGTLFLCLHDFPGPRKPIGTAAPVVAAARKSNTNEEKAEIDDEDKDVEAPVEQENGQVSVVAGDEELESTPKSEDAHDHHTEDDQPTQDDQPTEDDLRTEDDQPTEDDQRTEDVQSNAEESSDIAESGIDYSEEEIEEEEVTEYEEIEDVTDDPESTEESDTMEILEAIEEVPEESSSRGA